MQQTIARRLEGLSHLVGNTPLLEIGYRLDGRPSAIYAKSENLNMTGSIKDRMALHILKQAHQRGLFPPGATVVEATSGNTGISLAGIGRALGHPVTIFMPEWMSQERHALIRSFAAQVRLVTKEEGGFVGSIELAEAYAREHDGCFLPHQFSNEDNVEAHEQTTGPEIWYQLEACGLAPDAFVAGVGTGGTIMGVGNYLRGRRHGVRVHPLEPASSPTLMTGHKIGKHRIQGISDEFIPPIVKLGRLDRIVDADDGDSIIMAQRLAAELGLGVGISSGANFIGAVQIQEELGPEAVVVTVFPDSNKKYLSTDLLNEEPVRDGFYSPRIELDSFVALGRMEAPSPVRSR